MAAAAPACPGRWSELDVKSEKLRAVGYGMAAWLIALCVCVAVAGLVGGGIALGYGARWQGTVMLAVGVGSTVAVVTLARLVVRSIRSK